MAANTCLSHVSGRHCRHTDHYITDTEKGGVVGSSDMIVEFMYCIYAIIIIMTQ